MTDELDEIFAKYGLQAGLTYKLLKQAIQALIDRECNKARKQGAEMQIKAIMQQIARGKEQAND